MKLTRLRIVGFKSFVESTDFLIEPGLTGEVASNGDGYVSVAAEGQTATVTSSVAETVSVIADPSPPPRIALPEQLVLGRERYGR